MLQTINSCLTSETNGNMKSFKLKIILILCIFAITACGGGGSETAAPIIPVSNPTQAEPANPETDLSNIQALYDNNTELEILSRFVRSDGVLVTRIGDRGRDRHAKDITIQDHYDHYLAHYWQYRTARIQLEDFVPTGQSLIRATFITEAELGAREFRVWFWGRTTSGQFHFNPKQLNQ